MLDRLVTGHLVVVLPGVGWLLLRLVSPHQDVAEVGAGGEDALGRAPAQHSTVQYSTAALGLSTHQARLEMNSACPPAVETPVSTKLSPVSRFHSLQQVTCHVS